MKRRKKCGCCRELYHPHPQTYRQQKTCDKPACRRWRKRRNWKRWKGKHPVRGDRYRGQQAAWRAAHRGYNRAWRAKHPGSVARNRSGQRRRNREKRGVIAKPTAWKRVHREKLDRIRRLRKIAKPTAWGNPTVQGLVIEGLTGYLEWAEMIAKPTGMDNSP